MKNVKNIQFRMKLKGQGTVNFDSTDQKFMMNRVKGHAYNRNDNVSYAKKKFFEDEDGNLTYKLSISSGCITHDIFKDEVPYQSNNVINSKPLLVSYLANPSSILRGYMFASRVGDNLKRKSAVTLVDAIQSNNSVSYIDTFSKSGKKNEDTEETDNTFFKKETIGEVEYESHGFIDLMQLQFMSCDQIFDRYGLNPDNFELYKKFLKSKMPSFDGELGYYTIATNTIRIPEYGFMFSNEDILTLVKVFFMNLLKTKITRKDGYAEVESLEYKLIQDVIDDSKSEEGWIEIKNSSDINAIDFTAEKFYVEEDGTEAEELRKAILEDMEAKKVQKKAKKAEKESKKAK